MSLFICVFIYGKSTWISYKREWTWTKITSKETGELQAHINSSTNPSLGYWNALSWMYDSYGKDIEKPKKIWDKIKNDWSGYYKIWNSGLFEELINDCWIS